jgi:hypothetical protein
LRSDNFAGDYDFDPAILLPAGGRVIACDRIRFSIANRIDRGWIETLRNQVRADVVCTILRKRLVE